MLSSDDIKHAALAVGFDDCGVARADALTDAEYPLREWLRRGWHGNLGYMERNIDMRMDPRLLVPGAKSVICCVSAYPPPSDISAEGGNNLQDLQVFASEAKQENDDFAKREKIAAYARHREYHNVIKEMLFALGDRLSKIQNSKFEIQNSKFCCDTVPISDKHWAARAGLGWIGRHTLLVTPRWGSWVNLGEIVTTEECSEYSDYSEYSEYSDYCAKCGKCVEACPNHALAPEGPPMMDVRRCTAYYTTHNPRPLPPDLDTRGYTLGCDLCQLACPFNQAARFAR
jgi:epoxyqueuosine reductase